MNWVCIAKVEVKASYELVEPKELNVALTDYTYYGRTENFSMSEDNMVLNYNAVLELQFNTMADFVANFEKELLNKMSEQIKWVENRNVAYDVKQVCGADVYF